MISKKLAPISVIAIAASLAAASPASASSHTCDGREATIVGTSAAETIRGTSGADVIVALGGNDVIYGLAGNDIICGNAGQDTIYGGNGRDVIRGGFGADELRGNLGNDLLDGGPGADTAFGGFGADIIHGRSGHDKLYGGPGNDRIAGNYGDDRLFGGAGANALTGGLGNDQIGGVVDPADIPTTGPVSEDLFETIVSNELFRLTNCARTGDRISWCEDGDEQIWDDNPITSAERMDSQGQQIGALARSTELDRSAQAWSEELQQDGSLHHDPDFGPENVAQNFVLGPEQTVENAQEAAARLMSQWIASDGHRNNILHENNVTYGSGAAVSDQSIGDFVIYYATQRFVWG